MDNPQVEEQITRLKDANPDVRRSAANALGKIGDASAVPGLVEALEDRDNYVRNSATFALGCVGDASAVLALVKALQDEDGGVRIEATYALGKIGDISAIPALIEGLKDANTVICQHAAEELKKMGDPHTLPRKILADARWSARERINVLDSLRRVRYNVMNITVRYEFPETRALCQTVLNEENDEARKGAQVVLDWLNGDRHLLHASQPDPSKQSEELLRAAQGGEKETRPDTLLRAGEEPEQDVSPAPPRPTIWQRLFGK